MQRRNLLLTYTWMRVSVCVCVHVAFEEKWVQLGLIRVPSMPLKLSQTQLSFNMPFPMRISLSHVTELMPTCLFLTLFRFLCLAFLLLRVPSVSPVWCCTHLPLLLTTTAATISTATESDSLSGPSAASLPRPGYFSSQHTNTFRERVTNGLGCCGVYWNEFLKRSRADKL